MRLTQNYLTICACAILLMKGHDVMPGGKIALVTGAGSGIGRAVSLALHENGWSVVLAGRRVEELEQTAGQEKRRRADARLLVVPTDVSKPDAVRALCSK